MFSIRLRSLQISAIGMKLFTPHSLTSPTLKMFGSGSAPSDTRTKRLNNSESGQPKLVSRDSIASLLAVPPLLSATVTAVSHRYTGGQRGLRLCASCPSWHDLLKRRVELALLLLQF